MQAIRLFANTGNSERSTVTVGGLSAFAALDFLRKPDQLSYVREFCGLHLGDKGFRRPRAPIRDVACPDFLVIFRIFDQSTGPRGFPTISQQPALAELLVEVLNTGRVNVSGPKTAPAVEVHAVFQKVEQPEVFFMDRAVAIKETLPVLLCAALPTISCVTGIMSRSCEAQEKPRRIVEGYPESIHLGIKAEQSIVR